MLRLQNVSLVRGVRVLYKNVNLTTSDGEIIGLVGPNGPASPRFFAAILGELSTEDGDILAPPLNRISHVAQRVVETDLPALEYILEGHAPLMEAKAELKRAEEAAMIWLMHKLLHTWPKSMKALSSQKPKKFSTVWVSSPMTLRARSQSFLAVGETESRWLVRSCVRPICFCWMSLPTIWTLTRSSGSKVS